MKRYIYPMVLFTDENDLYTALYPDLNLLASGSSIEDVYARATDYLDFYLNSALKYETKIANMSTYAEIQALNPKKIVLLGYVDIDDDSIILSEREQTEKNFLEEFVFTEED
jgi:predicted RNase H-like HicB family nuclease